MSRRAALVAAVPVFMAISGCDRPCTAPERSVAPPGPRIVSLSPALTHLVEALGARDAVVGCTPWCGIAGARVVGSLEDRDLEAIVAFRPTLVLVQASTEDAALGRVATDCGARLRRFQLNARADVLAALQSIGDDLQASGVAGAAERARTLRTQADQALRPPVGTTRPVLFLFSVDPPTAFGHGTYVDELWSALGGRNAVQGPGYPAMGAEDVIRLSPAAVVVVSAGSAGTPPAWWDPTHGPWITLSAPELLEPSARMLTDGPARLRDADAAIAASAEARP